MYMFMTLTRWDCDGRGHAAVEQVDVVSSSPLLLRTVSAGRPGSVSALDPTTVHQTQPLLGIFSDSHQFTTASVTSSVWVKCLINCSCSLCNY